MYRLVRLEAKNGALRVYRVQFSIARSSSPSRTRSPLVAETEEDAAGELVDDDEVARPAEVRAAAA